MREEERALQDRLAKLQPRLEAQETPMAGGLSGELSEAERTYGSLVAKVRKENQEQASLMAVEPLAADSLRELLEPGQTLMEYFVGPEEVFLWVVTREKLKALTIPVPREKLLASVNSLRSIVSGIGPIRDYETQALELYRLLVEPALPHIQGKELIIVPHGVLHYLPFQALYSPQGTYLIEDYSIGYLSNASLLLFTTRKRRALGDKVLVFGNPHADDPKRKLNFAELEASEIKTLYPSSTVLLQREATKRNALELSSKYDILHFAAHAELNSHNPLASGILLAKNGQEEEKLDVKEVFGMSLNAGLVVLSGCETALGQLSAGDELTGLTRAFIYAGTPSVVASLWKVDDASTARLMSSFYKNLKKTSKVEALRQAQVELILGKRTSDLLARRGVGGVGRLGETPPSQLHAPGPEPSAAMTVSTSHPYFWAPFILVGDGK